MSPKLSEYQKKKSFPQFGTEFGRNLWDLFVLTGPFLCDQPALKSRWGTLNLDGGMLNLDEGTLTLDGGTLTLDGGR